MMRHGFKISDGFTKVTDAELLQLSDDEVAMMMESLSAIKYEEWKLARLKSLHRSETAKMGWGGDEQQRCFFRQKAIEHTTSKLMRFKK